MTCAQREAELALLVSEDLDEPAATLLRRHLDDCAGCRVRLDEFRGGINWLRGRRHTPKALRLGVELQARIGRGIAQRAPVPWPFTLVRRLLDALPRLRLHHETLVASLAGGLLLVGAIGALQRPLSGHRLQVAGASVSGPVAATTDRHDDLALESEADEALSAEGAGDPDAVEPREPGETPPEADDSAEPGGELVALSPSNGLRIELQTRDPDVRIIWFAGASAP